MYLGTPTRPAHFRQIALLRGGAHPQWPTGPYNGVLGALTRRSRAADGVGDYYCEQRGSTWPCREQPGHNFFARMQTALVALAQYTGNSALNPGKPDGWIGTKTADAVQAAVGYLTAHPELAIEAAPEELIALTEAEAAPSRTRLADIADRADLLAPFFERWAAHLAPPPSERAESPAAPVLDVTRRKALAPADTAQAAAIDAEIAARDAAEGATSETPLDVETAVINAIVHDMVAQQGAPGAQDAARDPVGPSGGGGTVQDPDPHTGGGIPGAGELDPPVVGRSCFSLRPGTPATVPDVAGLSAADAIASLYSYGLAVLGTEPGSTPPSCAVAEGTDPPAGAQIPCGSVVRLLCPGDARPLSLAAKIGIGAAAVGGAAVIGYGVWRLTTRKAA